MAACTIQSDQWRLYIIINTHCVSTNIILSAFLYSFFPNFRDHSTTSNLTAVCVCVQFQSFYRQIAGYGMSVGDHREADGERGSWANKIVTWH